MEKILISVISNLFEDNGTTVRAKRVAKLLNKDYDVTIVTRSNREELLNGGSNVDIKVIKPLKTKLWNLKLIPFIMKNKYNFIYCSNDFFGFLTYYLLSPLYNYKIIFEAHSIASEELKEKNSSKLKVGFYKILEKFIVRNADFIVTLSENTFDFYKRYNKNIEIVRVFVDDNFRIEKPKQKDKNINIGLIGPFDIAVNENFLEFLYKNIKEFDDNIKFIVIGKCDKRVENDKISYTGYIKNKSKYIKTLSSLDSVLVPSKIATLGPLNKILEPMACSVPVFTTPKGIVGLHGVKNNEDILIFEEEELVEGLNKLVFNEKLMEKIGRNSRKYFEKYYSKKVNEKKLLNIFKRFDL